jgi:hypothetical protein
MSWAANFRIGYSLRRHGERGEGSGSDAWTTRGIRTGGWEWADLCREAGGTRVDGCMERRFERQGQGLDGHDRIVADPSEWVRKLRAKPPKLLQIEYLQFLIFLPSIGLTASVLVPRLCRAAPMMERPSVARPGRRVGDRHRVRRRLPLWATLSLGSLSSIEFVQRRHRAALLAGTSSPVTVRRVCPRQRPT